MERNPGVVRDIRQSLHKPFRTDDICQVVFFEGDFYTARLALENLVRSASRRIIIIDGYVSALTLDILNVRKPGGTAVIYAVGVGQGMQRLMDEHDRLYHCGHSLNANGGHKISAIIRIGTSPEAILAEVASD